MPRTQDHRIVAVDTPLGADALLLQAMYGEERLGQPFTYQLDLLSDTASISFKSIVGQNLTVRLELGENSTRYFNGYVSRFTQIAEGRYRAEVVPWLWFLTRSADCRIFQNMTGPDIIKQVCRDHGFDQIDDRLTATYRQWEYCVQYRETAFNFISRLMEQEGIYYFFAHEDGTHKLVLCDAPGNHSTYPGYTKLVLRDPENNPHGEPAFWNWSMEQAVHAESYALNDYNFEKPRTPLEARRATSSEQSVTGLEMYDYPGEYGKMADGERYAQLRMEALEARHTVHRAESDARGVCVGHTLSLAEHWRPDLEGSLLITSVACQIVSDEYGSAGGSEGGGEGFSCRFTGIDAKTPFRLLRRTPKPVVEGPQTAVVVGQGDDGGIYTDAYGRVKVQFHWDRYGKANENSSCWIRVAQLWAGNQWGAMYLPRIGQEVIVDFLEGDPDRPIITGRVYNGANKPPYELPGEMTKSTIKSSTVGGEGFNEIRFDDDAGKEQIFIHAQKNQDIRVQNDCFEWIGNKRHLIVKTDLLEHVEVDRHEQIDRDHQEKVGRDRHTTVAGKEARSVGGSYSHTVKGDVAEVFKANHSEEVTQNYYVKAMGVVIEATTGITLKCGSNSVVIDPSGVTVKGTMVTLDGTMTKVNSGPGSSPTSGQAGRAVNPAAPEQAEEADVADPGEVEKIKAEQRQQKKGKYGSTPVTPFKPPTDEQQKKNKSWIEIELVDEADEPIPGEKYEVTLPDGKTVASGTLDEKGYARVEGIDPGNCKISFPNLDSEAWENA